MSNARMKRLGLPSTCELIHYHLPYGLRILESISARVPREFGAAEGAGTPATSSASASTSTHHAPAAPAPEAPQPPRSSIDPIEASLGQLEVPAPAPAATSSASASTSTHHAPAAPAPQPQLDSIHPIEASLGQPEAPAPAPAATSSASASTSTHHAPAAPAPQPQLSSIHPIEASLGQPEAPAPAPAAHAPTAPAPEAPQPPRTSIYPLDASLAQPEAPPPAPGAAAATSSFASTSISSHLFSTVNQLTAGSCQALQNAAPGDASVFDATHTLQLLSIRLVSSNNTSAPERYRIIVSDGEHFIQVMLAPKLNSLVKDEEIRKNTIVNVTKMTCNFVQDKRLQIILELDVVEHTEEKIGSPASLGQPAAPAPAPTPATAAATSSASASTSASHAPAAPAPQAPQPPRSSIYPIEASVVQPEAPAPAPAAAAATSSSASASTSTSTHHAPAAPAPQAPQPHRSSIYPIEGLSPYQNNWTIKARVTQKSDIRTYSNQNGNGKLFNVILMDETGEIRATGFNAVVDSLYDRLEVNKVYFISKGRVNIAKKQFCHLNNEYEIGLERNTEVEECLDPVNVPLVTYNFIALGDLESQNKDSTCDVIGLVKEVSDLSEVTSKATNQQVIKRELTLVDTSEFSVRMTLWDKQAEQFESPEAVIAFKNVKVGDYGGRTLSFLSSSTMSINPDIPEAHALRGWYDENGKNASHQAHHSSAGGGASERGGFVRSEVRSLLDVKSLKLGQDDRQDYFSTRATVLFVKTEPMWYPACQKPDCYKKVTEDEASRGWRCEKCNTTWPKPQYRYVVTMACADFSDQAWLQGFNDVGEMADDEGEFTNTIQMATCESYNFFCRAKTDTYNGQPRVRYGILKIQPLNYKEEAKALRDALLSPWGQTAL
ncbi:hypothetical protein FB451DRAFT_1181249 [Mycena latifolia]|nr:hypothetical protein FB451DRAFT_1181249 [Mycena latifolia]